MDFSSVSLIDGMESASRWCSLLESGCQEVSKKTKVLLAGADAVFDLLYLLVAILFTEKGSFNGDSWWVATLVSLSL